MTDGKEDVEVEQAMEKSPQDVYKIVSASKLTICLLDASMTANQTMFSVRLSVLIGSYSSLD